MFFQIFLFELRYRLRRPAFYIYFFLVLGFSVFSFARGMVPGRDREFINAPAMLTQFSCILSFMLTLMSASIMGVPLYRDIEHGTKEYYLSYPITKPGYFWGRFLGSFLFVMLTGAAVMLGAWLGSLLGPALGIQPANRYGAHRWIYYWQPYWTIILPNLLLTSSIFFGLVSVFRTVKVIYSGAMFLFLGYLLANFFLNNIHNPTVIYLSDPFLLNGLRSEFAGQSVRQLNTSVLPLQGLLLQNRILWVSIGLLCVGLTYWRFSFQRFFSAGRSGRRKSEGRRPGVRTFIPGQAAVQFEGGYHRRVLYNLTKIEIVNLVRDSYLWVILSGGYIFLGFLFVQGPGRFGVRDYPRTSFFMAAFHESFMFFVFLILAFYTGETVHREKTSRYSLINDTLPPATWVLNSAKLISLLGLGVFLALTPVWMGLLTQVVRGYPYYNLSQYASSELVTILPKTVEVVLLCYGVHVAVNNKFLGHGIAITFYTILLGLTNFGFAEYNLLLYSYTPNFWSSDMDGLGHMVRPLLWYQLYWTLAGALLVVLASLLYARGTRTSFGEKMRLAGERFRGWSRWGAIMLGAAFLAVGGYIYYNVSYRNEYLTKWEREERSAMTEKQLKKYADWPLPRLTRVQMQMDIFPLEKKEVTRAFCTIANRGERPIDSLLLDGDGLDYSLLYNGRELGYRSPLKFSRGKYSLFRKAEEESDYRMYRLPVTLRQGDSLVLEVRSTVAFEGFQNGLYAAGLLNNGVLTGGNLPAMGYDRDDELGGDDVRKEHGLPKKKVVFIPQDDPAGKNQLKGGINADLVRTDITVSVPEGQLAVAPGRLQRQWTQQGRNFFHYVQEQPGIYMPMAILSAQYAVQKDTVQLVNGRVVPIRICYHPTNDLNLTHFNLAMKDGIRYFSNAFGSYPFGELSLVETPSYGPQVVLEPGVIGLREPNTGWIADLRGNAQPDYAYFNAAGQVARQWWGLQVAPNNTQGSGVVGQAISDYSALRLMERRYGKEAMAPVYEGIRNDYWWRRRQETGDVSLLHAGYGYISTSKGALVLYGLSGMMGEDSLNAALSAFLRQWAFRNGGPYAGANDLYAVLKAHTPDSLRYYLEDSWEKVVLYDNKVVDAALTAKDSGYVVRVRFSVRKNVYDDKGEGHEAADINDVIEIGVYGDRASGLLGMYRGRFTAGEHVIELRVGKKPAYVELDPNRILLDERQEDNRKESHP